MSLLTTVVPALLPVVSDGIRGAIGYFTKSKGARPLSTKEAVDLIQAETEKLKALAAIDNVGQVSLAVNNIRALQRPVAAALVIISWLVVSALDVDEAVVLVAGDLASAVVFYLFGDRTYMYLRRPG